MASEEATAKKMKKDKKRKTSEINETVSEVPEVRKKKKIKKDKKKTSNIEVLSEKKTKKKDKKKDKVDKQDSVDSVGESEKKAKKAKKEGKVQEIQAAESEKKQKKQKKQKKPTPEEVTKENDEGETFGVATQQEEQWWDKDEEEWAGNEEDNTYGEEQQKEHYNFGKHTETINVRMFLGNLSFKIDENAVHKFFEKCGVIQHIQWLTDKASGKFYGSGFCTFDSMESAQKAMALNGKKLLGRPMKVGMAVHRENNDEAAPNPVGWGTEDQGEGSTTNSSADTDNTSNSGNTAKKAVVAKTRVFLGNLSFKIDEDLIRETFKECGEIDDIFWVLDQASGKFYGSAIATFTSYEGAQAAQKLNASTVLERPMKVGWASAGAGGGMVTKDKGGAQALSKKPDYCQTVFLGNLSFSIDEDTVRGTFSHCGDIKEIRFLERDGQFKGCGWVDFHDTSAVDEAIKLNGHTIMGRAMRVDYN